MAPTWIASVTANVTISIGMELSSRSTWIRNSNPDGRACPLVMLAGC